MTPPFFTASLSRASAAVVPWVAADAQAHLLQDARPRESPTAGVGASDRSTMPNGTPSRRDASLRHQLAHAGDLERGLLDGLGHHVKGLRP